MAHRRPPIGSRRRQPFCGSSLVQLQTALLLCMMASGAVRSNWARIPLQEPSQSKKEVLVLGKLLGRTVILHDLFNHWTDNKYKKATSAGARRVLAPTDEGSTRGKAYPPEALLDLEEVYDRQTLALWTDVTHLREFSLLGHWNGSLDALLYFNPKHFPQMERVELTYGVDTSKAEMIQLGAPLNCSSESMSALKQRLAGHDVVGALVYEEVVRDSGHNVRLYETGEVCHDQYFNLSAKLVKSPQLVSWADQFIAGRLNNEKYVAVHIRPYPDTCLALWEAPVYDPAEAAKKGRCTNRNLFNVAANHTAVHMRREGAAHLFVVAHPLIRKTVDSMYATVGLKPVYYDMSDLEEQAGRRSVTLLSMVESEVAMRAAVFLGTPQSSMSGVIMQERAARGASKYTTLFIPKTTNAR